MEKAILAGGCFWGMEELFRQKPGVKSTKVGYAGGRSESATYELVKTGRTDHAEALEIEFDPLVLSFEKLVEFFFQIHDPTTLDRQGHDVGRQYRSAIFYLNSDQKTIAENVRNRATRAWGRTAVTEIVPFTGFYPAEDYHQKYLEKNPGGYTCHYVRKLNLSP